MTSFKKILLLSAVACSIPVAAQANTAAGLDTVGIDQIFAVSGQQVGVWNASHLNVMGGIQTGYDNTACAPLPDGNEGEQRYNESIHNYEFCNGTAWVPLGQSDPSGEMAFFLAPTCPLGWKPSDGTNGTVDMRGEFPRGLDNGRGVEPGRGLGSWEDATGIGQTVIQAAFIQFWNPDTQVWNGGNQERAGLNGYVDNQVMFTVRPRNVALLACSKI